MGAVCVVCVLKTEATGMYACEAEAGGRRKLLQTEVSLKPDIIILVDEGMNLTLTCNILPGIEVRRKGKLVGLKGR